MEEIRKYTLEILPSLDQTSIDGLLQKLVDLGVEAIVDLSLLQESDLDGILRPIQIRKFLKSRTSTSHQDVSYQSDTSVCSYDPSSSQSTPTLSPASTFAPSPILFEKNRNDGCWPYDFNLSFSPKVQKTLNSDNLGSKDRLQVVREIIDEVHTITKNPTKSQLAVISQRMIRKYSVLKDNIEGVIIGSGYDSLLKQLQSRSENLNRKTAPKRKKSSDDNLEDDNGKSNTRHNPYGCIIENVSPEITDIEDMEGKRKDIMKYEQVCPKDRDWDVISTELKETYPLQRRDIKNISTAELVRKWPILFEPNGLFVHFELLTGINIKENVQSFLQHKSNRLMTYLCSTLPSATPSEDTPLYEVIEYLIKYFKEEVEALLLVVPDTLTIKDIELKNTMANPRLVCRGGMQNGPYHVIIDGGIVTTDNNFQNAFCSLFALFYILGIEYQANASATLEFFQRSFVNINPVQGSKSSKKKKSLRGGGVNPKILRLTQSIGPFEWTQ